MRRSTVIAVAVAALALPVAMWSRFVDGMIFQPSPGADIAPSDLGVEAEEVFLTTEDGVRIHAYYLPARTGAKGDRAILFLHGNAGNASHRLPNAALLADLGTDVLLLDYRGYGRSEGRPSEAGVYADARAGLDHLTGERGLTPERIVLFGRSLGGAVAVDLAQGRPLAGLILESTFTSVAGVVRSAFGAPLAALVRGRFASDEKIGRVQAPLLFFHGDSDRTVPFPLGRALFDIAPEPKQFETLEGAGHNDTFQRGGRPYLARIGRFLDEVSPR